MDVGLDFLLRCSSMSIEILYNLQHGSFLFIGFAPGLVEKIFHIFARKICARSYTYFLLRRIPTRIPTQDSSNLMNKQHSFLTFFKVRGPWRRCGTDGIAMHQYGDNLPQR